MNNTMLTRHRFTLFFKRDVTELRKIWKRIAVNFVFIVPFLSTLCFGYIVPNILFQNASSFDLLVIMAGSILWVMFPIGFILNFDFLRDREQKGFITYQITLVSTRVIILERLLFSSLTSWFFLLWFYPMAFLFLFKSLVIPWYRWIFVAIMLYFGSLFCCAFNLFFVSYIKDSSLVSNFWMRFNNPMIMLGGFFMPWYGMYSFSPLLAAIIAINPLLYVTEGLRSAITGSELFIAWYYAIAILCAASALFYYLACYYLKKQLDSLT